MVDAPIIVVGIGEIKIGRAPAMIRTNLGSCIGVCLFHPETQVGGMLHCMLPYCAEFKDKPGFRKTKYADSGLEELLSEIKRNFGIMPHQLKAKIFGGASMLKVISMNIGANNEQAVRDYLKQVKIPILKAKTGGEKGYQIDFDLSTGSVYCRVFGQATEEF